MINRVNFQFQNVMANTKNKNKTYIFVKPIKILYFQKYRSHCKNLAIEFGTYFEIYHRHTTFEGFLRNC